MESITKLEDWKIDSFFLKGEDTKNGIVSNTTLGGITYNIMNFIDYKYELKLMYLTEEEVKKIRADLLELSKANKKISFNLQFLKKLGFVSFSNLNIINLNFNPADIKIKNNDTVVGYYDLTLKCFERVNF